MTKFICHYDGYDRVSFLNPEYISNFTITKQINDDGKEYYKVEMKIVDYKMIKSFNFETLEETQKFIASIFINNTSLSDVVSLLSKIQ